MARSRNHRGGREEYLHDLGWFVSIRRFRKPKPIKKPSAIVRWGAWVTGMLLCFSVCGVFGAGIGGAGIMTLFESSGHKAVRQYLETNYGPSVAIKKLQTNEQGETEVSFTNNGSQQTLTLTQGEMESLRAAHSGRSPSVAYEPTTSTHQVNHESQAVGVPEPSSILLAAMAAAGLGGWQLKRRQAKRTAATLDVGAPDMAH